MASNEQLANLRFPFGGVNVSEENDRQPPGTTPVGQNVRVFEALTGRARGGSRAGIAKYIPERVSGANPIQSLSVIVTASGEALGWSANGIDYGDDPFGGIDFGPAGVGNGPDGPVGGGGGGYQPSVSFQDKRKTVGYVIAINLEDSAGGLPNSITVRLNGSNIGGLVIDSAQPQDQQMWRTDPSIPYSDDYLAGSFAMTTTANEILKSKFVSGANLLRLNLFYIGGNDQVSGNVQVTIVKKSAGGTIWLTDSKPLIDDFVYQSPAGGPITFDFPFALP